MVKKKNRSNNAEDKDQVIAKLQQQLEESQKAQKELQQKLDRLVEGLLPPESGGRGSGRRQEERAGGSSPQGSGQEESRGEREGLASPQGRR